MFESGEYPLFQERAPMTVSQLTGRIRFILEDSFPNVKVIGEISGLSKAKSGHIYFSLKDENSALPAVMWRGTVSSLTFEPSDGIKVEVVGDVTLYEVQGKCQLTVSSMKPIGLGELELKFRLLKEKLQKEGLFDPQFKKPLPVFPMTVGIVTSEYGAAIHDMLRVLKQRNPLVNVVLRPSLVQGEKASNDISAGIRELDAIEDVDLIIVGRGGGSYEDLFCFNDESLARTIFAADKPIISAVGHESDFTLSDFVADVRAATPTDAAVRAVPRLADLLACLEDTGDKLASRTVQALRTWRTRLERYSAKLRLAGPMNRLAMVSLRIDQLAERLQIAVETKLRTASETLKSAEARLIALSPERVLERGYSIVMKEGVAITDSKTLRREDEVSIVFFRGAAVARVVELEGDTDD
ncbi:MAG: exodeoxyribonuclease VII large subunit [Planctomycetota bacterium]